MTELEKNLVSIIIPTYNCAKYLSQSIESALRQSYPRTEVIVVDDGSTDETREIVSRYPVKYIHQRHKGVAIASNKGIKESKGEFFVRLDADDILYSRYVEMCIKEILKDERIGFVMTGNYLFGEINDGQLEINIPRRLDVKYNIFAYGTVNGSALTRRKAFDSLEEGYDPKLPALEDFDLYARMRFRGWKAGAVFKPILFYRQRLGSRGPKDMASVRAKYCLRFIDKKFWYRRLYLKIYELHSKMERLIRALGNPRKYIIELKRKWKLRTEIKSYSWKNPQNREKAFTIAWIIELELENYAIDLRELKDPFLCKYRAKRIAELRAKLLRLRSEDAGE